MLTELNELASTYKPITDLIWSVLPFILSVIMVVIAYEQYKIRLLLEHEKTIDKFNNSKENLAQFEKSFKAILEDKTGQLDKQEEIIKELDKIAKECSKFEYMVEYSDRELIKESFKNLKAWIRETKTTRWTFKTVMHAFSEITTFLSYVWYMGGPVFSEPNKNLTLYSLLGLFICRVYTFLMPYFIQKWVKKIIYPKVFKFKAYFLLAKFVIGVFKDIFKPEKKDNKSPVQLKIATKIEEDNNG